MQHRNTLLAVGEIQINEEIILGWINLARTKLLEKGDVDESHINEVSGILDVFVTQNNITLGRDNLSVKEEKELRNVFSKAIRKKINKDEFLNLLTLWKGKLKNAVYGQGATRKLHDDQYVGVADQHARGISLKGNEYLTGKDLQDLFQGILVHADEIVEAKKYVLIPQSLTESEYGGRALPQLLQTALASISGYDVKGKVTLYVPLSINDGHWCFAEFKIKNQVLQEATLWDSMGGLKSFNNEFGKIVRSVNPKVEVSEIRAGVQSNSHSCGDYVAQEIFKRIGVENNITRAGKNARPLRDAIVDGIYVNRNITQSVAPVSTRATNKPEAPVVNANILAATDSRNKIKKRLKKYADKSTVFSEEDHIWISNFDEIFAKKLQDLYDAHPAKDNEQKMLAKTEKYAIKVVKEQAIKAKKDHGLFRPASTQNDDINPHKKPRKFRR